MKRFTLYIPIIVAAIFVSCEKIIEVDVDDADNQTVVEAILVNQFGLSTVIVSKSGPLFEEGDIKLIDSAVVEVTDENGNVFVFQQISSGIYINPTFIATPGVTYDLYVKTDKGSFTSTSTTPQPVDFDTTYIDYNWESPFGEITPRVHFQFTDLQEQNNHYRIIAYKNGEKQSGFSLYDDEVGNGEVKESNVYQFDFEQGDTLYVDLMSVNEAYYEYFRVLSAVSSNFGASGAPGNPPSNIESDQQVQGYFGTLCIDRDTLIVTQ